ncbi:ABC transporter permease [Halopenitus persicus]|uniref:ABC transporter permease n=1 Tax=Halopenitus persicus TaxID=1048396 RepID=UPI000BBAB9C4|nr:ABC transporter permease [Halopenitus persicus]
MSRATYYIKRTLISILLILLIITGLFLFFRLMPGSYIDVIAQSGASAEQLEAIRERWGLNQPLYVQWYKYMINVLAGDFGTSRAYGVPVIELVIPRLLNSFILVGPAITVAYILGSVYGLFLGNSKNSLLEKYGIVPPTIFGTTPDFFIAIVLIFIFSGVLGILPAQGMVSSQTSLELSESGSMFSTYGTMDFWIHYILPFCAIVLRYLYYPSMIMRSSVVEVSGQDFMYYHRLKGIPKLRRFSHLMRHASLPVLTLFPVTMSRAISGLVLVEVVFNWPGIGSLVVESVLLRDTPVVQFVFILVAVWVILGNYLVDVLYGIIDPRISIEGEKG